MSHLNRLNRDWRTMWMMGIIGMTPALQATSFPSVYGTTCELHHLHPLTNNGCHTIFAGKKCGEKINTRRSLECCSHSRRRHVHLQLSPSQFCQNLGFFQTMGHPVLAKHLGSSKKNSSVTVTGDFLSRFLTGNVSIPGGFSKRFVMDYWLLYWEGICW